MMQIKPKYTIGSIIFFLGIFIGLALAVVAIWGDFEGLSYYYTGATYGQFNGLHCPILMTSSESGTVTAILNNSSNEKSGPYYQKSAVKPLALAVGIHHTCGGCRGKAQS